MMDDKPDCTQVDLVTGEGENELPSMSTFLSMSEEFHTPTDNTSLIRYSTPVSGRQYREQRTVMSATLSPIIPPISGRMSGDMTTTWKQSGDLSIHAPSVVSPKLAPAKPVKMSAERYLMEGDGVKQSPRMSAVISATMSPRFDERKPLPGPAGPRLAPISSSTDKVLAECMKQNTPLPAITCFSPILSQDKVTTYKSFVEAERRESTRLSDVLSPVQNPGSGRMLPDKSVLMDVAENRGDSLNDTTALFEKYQDMLNGLDNDIKSEFENDRKLKGQDTELEENMELLDELREEYQRERKQLDELTKMAEVYQEQEQTHRVTYNTYVLDDLLYSMNSDKLQEQIWKLREEIIQLECMRDWDVPKMRSMCTDNLKEMKKEQNENNKLESEIEELKRALELYKTSKMSDPDCSHSAGNLQNGMKDVYFVLPKIHRRKSVPDATISSLATTPDRHESELRAMRLEPLPPIDKQGRESHGLGISQTYGVRKETSDVPCLMPRPPSARKSSGKYTRRHLLQKIK